MLVPSLAPQHQFPWSVPLSLVGDSSRTDTLLALAERVSSCDNSKLCKRFNVHTRCTAYELFRELLLGWQRAAGGDEWWPPEVRRVATKQSLLERSLPAIAAGLDGFASEFGCAHSNSRSCVALPAASTRAPPYDCVGLSLSSIRLTPREWHNALWLHTDTAASVLARVEGGVPPPPPPHRCADAVSVSASRLQQLALVMAAASAQRPHTILADMEPGEVAGWRALASCVSGWRVCVRALPV